MSTEVRIPTDLLDAPDVDYKNGFFVRSPKALLYTFDLSPQAKILWLILEEHAGQNRKANAGQKRLAALMNLSVRSVSDYVNELRDQGWLVTHGSTGDALSYTLAIPAVRGGSMSEDYRKKNTRTSLVVQPKDLKKIKNKITSGLEAKTTDQAVKLAVSANHAMLQQNLAEGGYEESCVGGMKNPAYPYEESCVTPYAESCVQTIRREQEEVTENKERPFQTERSHEVAECREPGVEEISSGETDISYSSLASGDRSFASHSSGLALVDVVEADASPTSSGALADPIAADAALVSPSGSEEVNPGYSSVTTEISTDYEDIHVYNETVTYLTNVNEATDGSLSASGAMEVEPVQEIPAKPEKPVYVAPGRNPHHDDMAHEKRVQNSLTTHLKAMGKWKQDMNLWEQKYGDNPTPLEDKKPVVLSEESQARLDRYKIKAHAF